MTGGAGYIGSHMTQRLLNKGDTVKVVDKIPIEKANRLESVLKNQNFTYSQIDLSESNDTSSEFRGVDTVIHFAAIADIFLGFQQTDLDLKQGTYVTYNVLESMRKAGVKEIIYSSTGTVYGFPSKIPTPEDGVAMLPVSLYGAAKLASEGLISGFCHLYGMKSWIFRFGNIIGRDSRRGVIYDLTMKLKENPKELEVLGDGMQLKDYVYIDDCLDAMLKAHDSAREIVNVFNIGSGSNLSVKELVTMLLEEMNMTNVKVNFTGGPKSWHGGGWPGDITKVLFDIKKLKGMGWKPKYSSREAVRQAIKDTLKNIAFY